MYACNRIAALGALFCALPAFARTAAAASAWPEVASVLRHPRCMNCHTVTDLPRQGDDRHRHQKLVMRGAEDRDVAVLFSARHVINRRTLTAARFRAHRAGIRRRSPWSGKAWTTPACAQR
jgi:hypothetical protein